MFGATECHEIRRVTQGAKVYANVFNTFINTHYYLQWINMIETKTKTIAMLMIAIATVGVTAMTMSSAVPVLADHSTTETNPNVPPNGQVLNPNTGVITTACGTLNSCPSTTTTDSGHGGTITSTTIYNIKNPPPPVGNNAPPTTTIIDKCQGSAKFLAANNCVS